MIDNYVRDFNDLFYDVKKNEAVYSTIEQVSSLFASIIIKYVEVVNELSLSSSKENEYTNIVICLFARKIMEQLDAINVLFSVGSFTQAQVILRSMIENCISLEFILKEDTQKRAASYFLERHYLDVERGENFFDRSSFYGETALRLKGEEQFEKDHQKYIKKKEAFRRIINSRDVFLEIDGIRNINSTKKGYNKWYKNCSDVKTFKDLMKVTGYEKYYQSIYGGLSNETHAYNSTMELNVDMDGISLKFIRYPEGGENIFSFVCSFSISALMKIYKYLNDGEDEKKEFHKFYKDFEKKRDIAIHNLNSIK